MENDYEQVASMDKEAETKAAEALERSLCDSDTVFVSHSDLPGWIVKGNGITVMLTPDYEHGLYHLDSDTGITIASGQAVATYALANFLQEFTYKIGRFWAVAPDGTNSWSDGSRIHFGYDRMIGDEDVDDAIRRVICTVPECAERLAALNDGTYDLREAARSRLSRLFHHLDS